MYGIIFSAVFCFFAGLAILFGALKGRKYKWQYSLSRLIVVIISVIASAILASVISNAIVGTVVIMLIDSGLLSDIGGIDVGAMVNSLESGVATIKALGSMIVSPMLFVSIFLLLKSILNLYVKLIAFGILSFTKGNDEKEGRKFIERKHYKKKYEKLIAHYPNVVGGLFGALCSVFVLCAFICPLVCSLGVIDSVAPVDNHIITFARQIHT